MRPKNFHIIGVSLNIPLSLFQSSNCLVRTTPHLILTLCSDQEKWSSISQFAQHWSGFTTLRQSNVSIYAFGICFLMVAIWAYPDPTAVWKPCKLHQKRSVMEDTFDCRVVRFLSQPKKSSSSPIFFNNLYHNNNNLGSPSWPSNACCFLEKNKRVVVHCFILSTLPRD